MVDGEILVCGGRTVSACYSYLPEENSWQKTGSLDQARGGAGSLSIDDREWWISGGSGSESYLSSSLIYQGRQFTAGPDLPYPSADHCVVRANETHIVLIGGQSDLGVYRKDAYILDWTTMAWTKLPDLSYERKGAGCGLLQESRVVVTGSRTGPGGNSTEILNLDNLTWELVPGSPGGTGFYYYFSQPYQLNGTFYLLGGFDGSDKLDNVFEFDMDQKEWVVRKETLSMARYQQATVALSDDDIQC